MTSDSRIGLMAQLEEARKEIEYYRRLAREAGNIRLRETEELSNVIGDLRRTKQTLEQEKLRFLSLAEQAPYAMAMISPEGHFLYVNPKFEEMFGYDLSEIPMGRDWFRKAYPNEEYRHQVIAAWLEDYARSGPGEQRHRIFAVTCKDGREKIIHFRPVQFQTGEHLMTCEDITERTRAREALERSEANYRAVLDSMNDAVFVHDAETGAILDVNNKMSEMYGYTRREATCLTVEELSSGKPPYTQEEAAQWITRAVEQGPQLFAWMARDKTGRLFWVEVNLKVAVIGGERRILAVVRDITDRSEQLFQAQKMQAIGTLAGGIAHDFNNLLQAIFGYSELLLMNPKLEEKSLMGLNRINQAARNGAALVKGLLTLSGRMESQRRPINVNRQVDEVVKLLSRTIPKVIELESYLDAALSLINGDPVQVHQVLMNLGINARDAMPDGGRLVFETSKVSLDETYCKTHVEAGPGTYVLISVSDTGTGMDQETAAHIFEPFFTTKSAGAGIGLGLSIVYGIVKQHGGYITCYSEPGRGTTFKVYFPIIEETVELSDEVSCEPLPPGGTETLLLVDDDEVVRELAESMLVEMGYTVLTASNGKEAVESYWIDRERISLVILDLIMPEMDGQRCLKEILKINSSARLLITSGHAENGLARETIERGARGFVHKPYEIRQLLQKVREVLDRE